MGHVSVVDSKNVIVPVGSRPPMRLAVAEAELPTDMRSGETEVPRARGGELTTNDTQLLVAALLLASPE
jgi:hypothetical protein